MVVGELLVAMCNAFSLVPGREVYIDHSRRPIAWHITLEGLALAPKIMLWPVIVMRARWARALGRSTQEPSPG
jgi:hypothetical protein